MSACAARCRSPSTAHEINEVIYFGLAQPSNNTVLPRSPLFKPEYQKAWTNYDVAQANRLLDEMGLTKRGSENVRLLPDGRPMEIIVETAGESTEEIDVLELIADSWRKIGVKLFTKPSQLEVLRNRIYSGQTMMAIAKGIDNGIPTADMAPTEFVPIEQNQYQWPKWGQFYETGGTAGESARHAPAEGADGPDDGVADGQGHSRAAPMSGTASSASMPTRSSRSA